MNFFNIFDTGINYVVRQNTDEELKEYVLPITCYMYDECVDKYGFANFLSDARYTSNGEKVKNWKEIKYDVADYELHIEDAYTC